MERKNVIGMVPFYLLFLIGFIGVANWFSDARTTAVQTEPVARLHTVIIDAGHGGIDGGATSCSGVLESEINLQIAWKLNDLLAILGHDTVMIRTTDTSVYTEGNTIAAQKVSDLKERVRIVAETENAILVSIHQNTFSDSRYGGAQVFYAATQGSRELAHLLQSSLSGTVNPGSNRKCKKADGVYLMEHIDATGVLIECGFLSNPEEEHKLRTEKYQQQLLELHSQTTIAALQKQRTRLLKTESLSKSNRFTERTNTKCSSITKMV